MISWTDVDALRSNWLLGRMSPEELDRAHSEADEAVAFSALPNVFVETVTPGYQNRVQKAAIAYEISVTSALPPMYGDSAVPFGVDDMPARASAYMAYDLLRALPTRGTGNIAMVDVLTRCALAYMGDRAVDIGLLVGQAARITENRADWDGHVFAVLFNCWVTLFGRQARFGEIGPAIGQLRSEQAEQEASYLSAPGPVPPDQRAMRLCSLYNWAKATELLAAYLRAGSDGANIDTMLDRFFGDAQQWAVTGGQGGLAGLLQWLRIAARRMVSLSVWNAARSDAARNFVERLATRPLPLLELLPPQRAALLDQGVLEQSRTAVVVDMPTSSGKTLLAEFRIVQTLMAFPQSRPWVAYVVPTRALAAQTVRRLRRDLGETYRIESLSAAVDVDSLETELLADANDFQILVCTAEKLTTLARSKRVSRPLRLVVVDEAHSIDDDGERGLKLELLLATLYSESETDFMLLMPYVPNGKELATWLSRGRDRASYADISLSMMAWKPNDVLIGTIGVEGKAKDWQIEFQPKLAPRTLTVQRPLTVAKASPLRDMSFSHVKNSGISAAAAMAVAFDNRERGVNLVMCPQIGHAWSAAELIRKNLKPPSVQRDRVELVRRFVQTEVGPGFALDDLLRYGVGVHHAGLPEDVRTLIEWLIDKGDLRAVCATSTIAQGMDFGVGSVFLTSLSTYTDEYAKPMTRRQFWNLAGRAGRVGQSHVGVVGAFVKGDSDAFTKLLAQTGDDVESQLEKLVTSIQDANLDKVLSRVRTSPDWAEFRTFVSHLVAQHGHDDLRADQLIRNTLGYRRLTKDPATQPRAEALLQATRIYASEVAPADAKRADSTGFSPDVIGRVMANLRGAHVRASDWRPEKLFSGAADSILPRLVGAMMLVPQIRGALKDFDGDGDAHKRIADISAAWVRGDRIDEIAQQFFSKKKGKDVAPREAITAACKALYRAIAFAAPWGLSSLMQLPPSGLNFDALDEPAKRQLNLLPAFLYHGVSTESGVAMRLNGVPRSIAEALGSRFAREVGHDGVHVATARGWLTNLSVQDWNAVRRPNAVLSGDDYRQIWREVLSPQPVPVS